MTDEQKCLEWLKHRRDNTPMAGAKRMFGIAISALEKQKPKTVRTEYDRRHNYFLHFCPVCGGLAREYEYCSECGQKLSYEEEEEEEA